jgi:hypothetical protein
MSIRELQKGSAYVIVIVLLVVALLGTLGFVFYQNFVAKKQDDTAKPATTTQTDTTATSQVAFNSTIYEVDHPKDWKMSDAAVLKTFAADTSGVIALENKAGTVRVLLRISDTQVTPSCDAALGLKVSYYKVNSTAVTKLTDETLYLVAAMTDHTGGGYDYQIGLTPEGGDTHSAVGDPHCNVMHVGIASTALFAANGKDLVRPSIEATIEFPKIKNTSEVAIKEMQPVKDMLATDDYKAAVKIIESARKK